jgi:hypothetical protein
MKVLTLPTTRECDRLVLGKNGARVLELERFPLAVPPT